MIATGNIDHRVRQAAFDWLGLQRMIHGDVLPRELLAKGFTFEGERVPLVSPQGIFKPKILPDFPLSIATTPSGPYDDRLEGEFLQYRYRGTDPNHRDNVALREALRQKVPLIYFHGIVKGKYLAIWPVFIIGDDPKNLTFTVAVEDASFIEDWQNDEEGNLFAAEGAEGRRAYITTSVKQRIHQRHFRELVLRAYREQCAFCRLRHEELLDAAHIIPDKEPAGVPTVSNGISLCKLHHAAFDSFIIGIRPDYIIEVRRDILDEHDGPMLQHGLQGLNSQRIVLPHQQQSHPDKHLLEERYARFRAAG